MVKATEVSLASLLAYVLAGENIPAPYDYATVAKQIVAALRPHADKIIAVWKECLECNTSMFVAAVALAASVLYLLYKKVRVSLIDPPACTPVTIAHRIFVALPQNYVVVYALPARGSYCDVFITCSPWFLP